jgi:hypothetical protein
MNTEQLHRNKWYDHIHANHICCVFWLFLMLLSLGVVLAYVVPVWQFHPVTTQCTLNLKNITKYYVSSDFVSWRVYRAELQVSYKLSDGTPVRSILYGPDNQGDFDLNYAGYSLSIADVTNFYNQYNIGGVYKCFYSNLNYVRVTFTEDPAWAALLVFPIICFLVAAFVCIYPPIDKLLRDRRKRLARLELYKEMEELEIGYDKEIFDSDDEGTYSVMVANRGGSVIRKGDTYQVDDDEDDEWIVQEEIIETVGRFFGIQVEEDGQYTQEPTQLLEDVADDVHVQIEEPRQSTTVTQPTVQRTGSVAQQRTGSVAQQRSASVQRKPSVQQRKQSQLIEMDDIKTDFTDVLAEPDHDDWENQPDEPVPIRQQERKQSVRKNTDDDDGEWQ